MNKLIQAGLAITLVAGVSACAGERPSFGDPEQRTEVARPQPNITTTTTIGDLTMRLDEMGFPEDTVVIEASPQETLGPVITMDEVEIEPVIEGCQDGDEYGRLLISFRDVNIDETAMCSGDGKYVKPSVFPGSPTLSEFEASDTLSTGIGWHRTALGGPFEHLDTLPIGHPVEHAGNQYSVSEVIVIPEGEFIGWYEANVIKSTSKRLILFTCGDLNGDAGGTQSRLAVVLIPTNV